MPEKNDSNNVRVSVRCRPLNSKEREQQFRQIVHVDEARNCLSLQPPDGEQESDQQERQFTFDSVFGPDSKQADVYNKISRPIVECVLEGYNGTIFAYGQTGTGKTFTMAGNRDVPELCGIIPNSFAHIFGHIAKAEGGARFLVRVSYLEIYNEEVRDLLGKDQSARLEVKERVDVGVYVKDLSSFVVNNAGDMDRLMTVGNKNRMVGATNMNEQSSRSHAIFSITVECSELGADGKQHVRTGKLHLVDLAGSERQSKTGATGIRLKEATKINLSLSTLGNVISSLVDGKSTHIPYRNSKLTRLLQDSLGGNAKTAMIANVGPADYNYDETLSTLRYANRAKNIKNNARINEDPKDALLREFQKQIEDLRRQLTGEGGDDDEDEEEEYVDERTGERRIRKVKRSGEKRISKAKMEEIQRLIEKDRRRLEEDKNMAEAARQKIMEDLEKKEAQVQAEQEAQKALREKLQMLERKVIVGGVNLLDKAAEQERLLEQNNTELEAQTRKAEELQTRLKEKETERLGLEERYTSLQDENEKKTAKMKKLFAIWQQTKDEVKDMREQHQREKEGLLENIRQLSKELKQAMALIDGFVPSEYQQLLDRSLTWNEDIGEWQLKCVAYTGNNMRKTQEEDDEPVRVDDTDLTHAYLAYSEEGARLRKLAGNPKRKKSKAAAGGASQQAAEADSDRNPAATVKGTGRNK